MNTEAMLIGLGVYFVYMSAVGFYEGFTHTNLDEFLKTGKLPPKSRVDAEDGSSWEQVRGDTLGERIFRPWRKGASTVERRLPNSRVK